MAYVTVISVKQALVCTFPHFRTPVGKQIRGPGLNLAAISALVEKILEKMRHFCSEGSELSPSLGVRESLYGVMVCVFWVSRRISFAKFASRVQHPARALLGWRLCFRTRGPQDHRCVGSLGFSGDGHAKGWGSLSGVIRSSRSLLGWCLDRSKATFPFSELCV